MAYNETYNANPVAAFVGMVADLGLATIISRTMEEDVGFGEAVVQGSADHSASSDLTGATEVLGITVRSQAAPAATPDQYSANESAGLIRKGVVWVTVTDAGGAAAGDPVWLTLSTGGFSNADAGGGDGLQLAGCRWESSAANGALAKIRVNLDVPAVAGAA